MSDMFCPVCEKSTAVHDGDCEHYHCSSCNEQWIKPIDVGALVKMLQKIVDIADSYPFCSVGHVVEHGVPGLRAEIDKWR